MDMVLSPVINGRKYIKNSGESYKEMAAAWKVWFTSIKPNHLNLCSKETWSTLCTSKEDLLCSAFFFFSCTKWHKENIYLWSLGHPISSWHLALQNRQYLAQARNTWVWAKSARWNCQLLQIVLGLTLVKGWGDKRGVCSPVFSLLAQQTRTAGACLSSAKSRKQQKPAGQRYLLSSSSLLQGQRKLGKPAIS